MTDNPRPYTQSQKQRFSNGSEVLTRYKHCSKQIPTSAYCSLESRIYVVHCLWDQIYNV